MSLYSQHPLRQPQSLPQAPREDQRLCIARDYCEGSATASGALEAIDAQDLWLKDDEPRPQWDWDGFLRLLQAKLREEKAEEYARRRG